MQLKVPTLRFQFQFFELFEICGYFQSYNTQIKDFRPFHFLRTQTPSGNHGTGQENRDGTRRDGCLDTTLVFNGLHQTTANIFHKITPTQADFNHRKYVQYFSKGHYTLIERNISQKFKIPLN